MSGLFLKASFFLTRNWNIEPRVSVSEALSRIGPEISILWAVSAFVGLCILGASFYLSPDAIERGTLSFLSFPHEHCPLCGMSHSLSLMSRGNFTAAVAWNPGGPILYSIALANTAIWFLAAAKIRISKRISSWA